MEFAADSQEAKEAKKKLLDEKWKAKLENRKQAMDQKRAKAKDKLDPNENVDQFLEAFKKHREHVLDSIQKLGQQSDLTRSQLKVKLDELTLYIKTMQKELADATVFLPPFVVKQSNDTISTLTENIQTSRTTLAPRKKFSFKERKKATAAAKEPAKVEAKPVATEGVQKLTLDDFQAVEHSLENLTDQTLTINSADIKQGQDIRLDSLSNCVVNLCEIVGALRCINLKQCCIYSGPVQGSSFFENCHDCTFMIASRQFRIHDSVRCDFYCLTLSRPIIEHCSGLRFAPYRLSFPQLEAQIRQAGLLNPEVTDTMWSNVDDFRWLRTQQSPNWSVLPEGERLRTIANSAVMSVTPP